MVNYLQAKLPASDADVIAGATLDLDGYLGLMDGQYVSTSLTTDFSYRRIDDGLPPGQAITHSVRAGETLQAIAQAYYGSPSYWYLIAAANGLSGSEELKEGTTITVPNQVANSVNDKDTYKLYSESEIIGSTSPELKIKKKKRSFFQRLIMIVIIVIIIYVAWYMADKIVPAIWGAIVPKTATGLALLAYGAIAVAAIGAVGYAIGVGTSILTQGLAIMADLQDGFDWKAMHDMGKSFAITAVAAGVGGWAKDFFNSSWAQSIAQGTIQASAQYLENGKITSVSGVLLAMIPAAAKAPAWLKNTAEFVEDHRNVVSAGLSVLEAVAKDEVNALSWTNFAMSMFIGERKPGTYLSAEGFDWRRIAKEALAAGVLSLVVGDKFGEDAAINFFGQSLGQTLTGVLSEKKYFDQVSPLLSSGQLSNEEFDSIYRDQTLTDKQKLAALKQIAAFNAYSDAGSAGAGGRGSQPGRSFTFNALTRRYEDQAGRPAPLMFASAETGVIDESFGLLPMGESSSLEVLLSGKTDSGDGYTVRKGDTLWAIAKSQLGPGASDAEVLAQTQRLMEANPFVDPNRLEAGSSLRVSVGDIEPSVATREKYRFADAVFRDPKGVAENGYVISDEYKRDLYARMELAPTGAAVAERLQELEGQGLKMRLTLDGRPAAYTRGENSIRLNASYFIGYGDTEGKSGYISSDGGYVSYRYNQASLLLHEGVHAVIENAGERGEFKGFADFSASTASEAIPYAMSGQYRRELAQRGIAFEAPEYYPWNDRVNIIRAEIAAEGDPAFVIHGVEAEQRNREFGLYSIVDAEKSGRARPMTPVTVTLRDLEAGDTGLTQTNQFINQRIPGYWHLQLSGPEATRRYYEQTQKLLLR